MIAYQNVPHLSSGHKKKQKPVHDTLFCVSGVLLFAAVKYRFRVRTGVGIKNEENNVKIMKKRRRNADRNLL